MHRKYRKLVSAGLVLTMAGAMTLQGCGQKEKTGKTEIELVQYKPEAVKTFEKIEEEFNRTHDDIHLTIESPNDAMTVLKTRFIREDNPDIIGIGGDVNYSNFIDSDMLMDISDYKGLEDIKEAYKEIDKNLEKSGKICNNEPEDNVYSRHAIQVMPVFKAIDGEKETVSLRESSGRICGEFAYIYPPGIPLLAPGERITEEILETLQDYIEKDLPVQGLEDTDLFTIQVMASSGDMSI